MQQTSVKEFNTEHDWGGVKGDPLGTAGKKMKFDHAAKLYMYKPESVLENKTHKIL